MTRPLAFRWQLHVTTLPLCLLAAAAAAQAPPAKPLDFAHSIAPLLKRHCLECHGGAESKGGFSFNTRELVLDAEAAVAGKSAESRLIALVTSRDEEEQMPPRGRARLSDAEVAALKRWIDEGLEWPAGVTFAEKQYEPPLRPRAVALPAPHDNRRHPVDRIVDRYLIDHQLLPAEPVGDAAFARRAYLDIVGLLPSPDQLQAFLTDAREDKREQLIADLLADDVAYAEHWLSFWNDLLRNDYTGTGFITNGRKQITGWLYRSLVENKRYDQLVRELIAPTAESEGFIMGIRWRGNVNASQTLEIQFAQNISQALLGINLKCASCHDSFIDRWTLEQTYGLAQIYSTQQLELHRCDKPTGKLAKTGWLFPELGDVDPTAAQPERLKQLAALMTHRDNGRLTRTIVNRIWHRLMGRGIVHPVDAMHTEPWSEELLDYLANDFAASGYDLRHIIATICTSQTYQARILPESGAEQTPYHFHGPLPRRLTAEQFVDSVWQLTGASPATPDADVMRAASVAAGADQPPPPQSSWIWNVAAAESAAAGEKLAFRKTFRLPAAPKLGVAIISCDNEYQWWINGKEVGKDDNWSTYEVSSIAGLLKAGDNEVLVVGANGGSGPNPAGLRVELRVRLAEDSPWQIIASDTSWQCSKRLPDRRGKYPDGADGDSWEPAQAVSNQAVWSSADGALRQAIALGANSQTRMVRASLMKNDELMRTLGRPNRDQIVTSRPTQLTTLEAIDLANGQQLADAIAAGAPRLIQGHPTAAELASWVFRFALSREPTAGEQQLAVELLGEMTPRNVEDFVWAVLMLPEFQLVR